MFKSFSKRGLFINRSHLYSRLILLLVFVLVVGYICTANIISTGSWRQLSVITFVLGIIYGFWLSHFFDWVERKFEKTFDKYSDNIHKFRLGVEGEELVDEELRRVLDEKIYHIFPNFQFKGSKFDIDFIIIGPKGVILLEVKNYTNKLKFFDDHVNYVTEWNEGLANKDPRVALSYYKTQLHDYLRKEGFDNLIFKTAVVFVDESKVERASDKIGMYIIAGVNNIAKYFSGLSDNPKYDVAFCYHLNEALERAEKGVNNK